MLLLHPVPQEMGGLELWEDWAMEDRSGPTANINIL